jgi:cytochrome c-type biogenesis protein CcmH
MTRRGLVAGSLLIVLLAAPAGAAPEDVANDISAHIMSPYCPGVTLHDCPSDSAVALRDRITAMAAGGMSRDEIMAELVDEFGPTIRAVPPASGSGLLAWVLPGIALVAGAGCAWYVIRRWTGGPATRRGEGSPPVPAPTAAERRVLDQELGKLRGDA